MIDVPRPPDSGSDPLYSGVSSIVIRPVVIVALSLEVLSSRNESRQVYATGENVLIVVTIVASAGVPGSV
jgi:hypothetical protein